MRPYSALVVSVMPFHKSKMTCLSVIADAMEPVCSQNSTVTPSLKSHLRFDSLVASTAPADDVTVASQMFDFESNTSFSVTPASES